MNDRRNSFFRLFLLILLCMGVQSLGAQTVTKVFKNEPLKAVLKEVERQTKYSIIYKTDEVNENKKITASFQQATVNNVLAAVLDKDVEYKLQNRMIIITKKTVRNIAAAPSQSLHRVTGKVVDVNGEPVIGASVQVVGQSMGTITNLDGEFTLSSVPVNAVVVVSYIGFEKKEIKVPELQKSSRVMLREDTATLEEVVVIGYGTQKKINLTGAVAVVDSKTMEDRPVPRASQMLQGTVPNMNVTFGSGYPGASATINIRGVNSISGNASPLVLIDGIEGDIDRLNPNDIASISVLKDASSAAIYGARASYGVILVTTKEGSARKTTVSYDGRYS